MVSEQYKKVMTGLEDIMKYPWHDLGFYSCWLAQSYFYTSRSTRLLLMASAHTGLDKPVLHRRYALHAGEEKGHDLLAIRDLKDLGWDLETIGEFPMTTAFYATQFYKIQNCSADELMGWVLPLEGVAVEFGQKIRDAIKKANPNAPTRFLDVHIGEDTEHVDEAKKAIESIKKENLPTILKNMELTGYLYIQMLEQCRERAALMSNKLKVG